MDTTSAHFPIPFLPVNFVFMVFLCLLPANLCLTLKNHCVHVSSFRGPFTTFPPWDVIEKCNPPKKTLNLYGILIKQLGPVNDWRGRCARPPLEWCCSYAQTSRGDLHGSNVRSFSSFSMGFFMCWNRVKKILTPLHLTTKFKIASHDSHVWKTSHVWHLMLIFGVYSNQMIMMLFWRRTVSNFRFWCSMIVPRTSIHYLIWYIRYSKKASDSYGWPTDLHFHLRVDKDLAFKMWRRTNVPCPRGYPSGYDRYLGANVRNHINLL